MLKMITSPMKEEFPRTSGEGTSTVVKTKEVEIYISPPPTYPPIRTEGMFISSLAMQCFGDGEGLQGWAGGS